MALLKRKRSGLSDPMSVVTNFVNACNRHDAEGVSACLHPDFDSIQPMYPSRNFRGADQVRRNWQAIFDAEPGFRLTVLRSAAAGDTVWLELHGAGRDAEVAGVFVMGVQGDRIRWARIYSALVEGAPGMSGDVEAAPPPGLREVPPLQDADYSREDAASAAVASDAGTVEEDMIAPVVDIDGNGRSFRRRKGRKGGDAAAAPAEAAVDAAEDPVVEEAAAALATVPEPDPGPAGEPGTPSASPVDSIDPENLVDAETLVAPEPPDELDAATPAPETPIGSDYDLENTMAVEAVVAPPEAEPDPDVMVETMVTVEPTVTTEPDVTAVTAEPEAAAGSLSVDWGKPAEPGEAATTATTADDPVTDEEPEAEPEPKKP